MRGSWKSKVALRWTFAVGFFLMVALVPGFAGTRLIAHFENTADVDSYGRDALRDFFHSQGATYTDNLYPNRPGVNNLAPFPLVNAFFTDGGGLPGDPFEIHQFAADGTAPAAAGLIGEKRFAAFGSGWCLGAQDQVEDFQINFINVDNEANDVNYDPGNPASGTVLLDNAVTGTVQDWSAYDALAFYICINASDIPQQQFFDDFKIQLWEYWVDVTPGVGGNPPTVNHNEREIWEVSLSQVLSNNGIQRFTGWKHLRIPFSLFTRLGWDANYWRYGNYVSQAAYNGMDGNLNTGHIRAIVFRKDRIRDAAGNPTEPDARVTVAIDEIVVTGSTTARVARINIPGATVRCDDSQPRGLCWAQLFAANPNVDDPTVQTLPYAAPVKPKPPAVAQPCVDVIVPVRDWQQLWSTFSAEVDNGAEAHDDDYSSEMVFVPQFQVPGTWVAGWNSWPDFSRRKGTMWVPAFGSRYFVFFTDWRYDYTNGDPDENYLVHYPNLDPSQDPRGGFIANYFRQYGYAYGTLFVLPRDDQGNIGRAEVVDVLFEKVSGKLRYERLLSGAP